MQVGSLGRTDKLLEGCPVEYDNNQEMEMKRLNMVPQVVEPVRADHEEKMQVHLMYHINPNKVQPSFIPMDHNKITFSKKQNAEE